ncbi:MAG TPA: hypothetical protein VNU46_00050 [Gemmatimonadaceae bacterium]|nr:hypothetical protein [Gemmatimonadaceae bacterium]
MIEVNGSRRACVSGIPSRSAKSRCVHFALLDPITGVSTWPLPDTGSCQTLADFARQHDIIFTTPMHGDVFLLWNDTLGAFHHTGFVLNVTETPTEWLCTTIEGNSNTDGSPHGYEVILRTRAIPRLGATRFIDWQMLANPVTFQ